MKGFKDFLLRGTLVELAVAFIMGTAFAAVTTTFTAIITSLVSKIFGGASDFSSWTPGGLPLGVFLNALIAFVIMAAVLYFLVVTPYNKAKERYFPTPAEPEGTPEDIALLTQIRDSLVSRGGAV